MWEVEHQHNPYTSVMGDQRLEGGRTKEQRIYFVPKLILLVDQCWKAHQREESLHTQVTGI